MSGDALVAALRSRVGPADKRLVLLCLADCAGIHNEVVINYVTLRRWTALPDDAIEDAVHELVVDGVLVPTNEQIGRKPLYVLNLGGGQQ
ncbi:hypothetical protein [Saccharopolyspora spinosa]|uniref:hypothetical protein n=1 Tax=Saccharopolyspora spinosa TaxID=60894 RepID=UPI0016598C78|nr:hypothetical protein [Saccharopolyspora spinosa]